MQFSVSPRFHCPTPTEDTFLRANQLTYWFLRGNAVIPIGVRSSRDSYSKFQVSLDDNAKFTLTQSREIDQELSLTHRFLKGEISGIDYINAIPEVEI